MFIKSLGALSAAGISTRVLGLHSINLFMPETLKSIGIQMYSIPHLLDEDFEGTLKMLADTGYKELEFAGPYYFSPQSEIDNSILIQMFGLEGYGYYKHKPEDLRKMLDDMGLIATSAHISLQTLEANIDGALEASNTMGHTYIVCPFLAGTSLEIYRKAADTFNVIGEKCKNAGIQFAYHNHSFEFGILEDQIPFKLLLDKTDDSLVKFELDIFWTYVAGIDPLTYFKHYPGRFPMVHIKDMKEQLVPPDTSFDTFRNPEAIQRIFAVLTDVGDGIIDFKSVLEQSENAGIKHFFVERDFAQDQLGFATRSYAALSQIEF